MDRTGIIAYPIYETVKVYFREHSVRVEVILLVSLIAMGRQVLEIDLHHIDLLILFGFSSLLLALAVSYFLVKRANSQLLVQGAGTRRNCTAEVGCSSCFIR